MEIIRQKILKDDCVVVTDWKKKKAGDVHWNGNLLQNLLGEPFQLCYPYPAYPLLSLPRWVGGGWETGSGPSHSALCPGRGSLFLGWFAWCPCCCLHIAGCLEAAAYVSWRASQGHSSAPLLSWSFGAREGLVYFAGPTPDWYDCSVCSYFGFMRV